MAEFVYNDHEHSATKVTPFYADMGRHPYKGTAPKITSDNPTAQEFADKMKQIREEVQSALKKAAEDMKRHYDKHQSESVEYKVGDKVWLEGTNLSSERPMKKLDNKRHGPFRIIQKVGHSAYKLALPKTWKRIHPVFNEVLLTPYKEPHFPNQVAEPPLPTPVVSGTEPEYEVEEIVDSRKTKGGVKYKVKWKGYGQHEMTWEPASNLANAAGAVRDFHRKQPAKPSHASLQKLEIPMSMFPKELLRPLPESITEPIPEILPSAALLEKLARYGKHA